MNVLPSRRCSKGCVVGVLPGYYPTIVCLVVTLSSMAAAIPNIRAQLRRRPLRGLHFDVSASATVNGFRVRSERSSRRADRGKMERIYVVRSYSSIMQRCLSQTVRSDAITIAVITPMTSPAREEAAKLCERSYRAPSRAFAQYTLGSLSFMTRSRASGQNGSSRVLKSRINACEHADGGQTINAAECTNRNRHSARSECGDQLRPSPGGSKPISRPGHKDCRSTRTHQDLFASAPTALRKQLQMFVR